MMEKTTEQMEEEIKTALVVMEEEGALSVIEQSKALAVTDIATKERSVSLEKTAKVQKKRYVELFKPFKGELKARHANACTKEKEIITPFDEVILAEGRKRATYTQAEQARLAKEAEERAEKEAAERAERVATAQKELDGLLDCTMDAQETLDLLYMTLNEDQPSEEYAQILRTQITITEAVIAGANREAAEKAAKAEMAAKAPPPPPPMAPPKVKGEVEGWAYKVTVTNMKALCQAIGEGKVATAAVKPADGKLNSYAKDGIIGHGQFGCDVRKEPTSFAR